MDNNDDGDDDDDGNINNKRVEILILRHVDG